MSEITNLEMRKIADLLDAYISIHRVLYRIARCRKRAGVRASQVS